MNTLLNPIETATIPVVMQRCFDRQREAYLAAPIPNYVSRCEDLRLLARMLRENQDALVGALQADYGNRSTFETLFAEIFVVQQEIRATLKYLKRWMRTQSRKTDWLLYPTSRSYVVPQPLGVVGVIVPWNFPIQLAFAPLVAIFAAGNRAMVKMSENSAHMARLLMQLAPLYFPAVKLTFFADDDGAGPAFSSLPFDHLLFTGSSTTGRCVMANAARNLTPVTLELGGKSPAIVAADFPLALAADRILWAKAFNAGQICINVDYLFLPVGSESAFTEAALRLMAQRYPDINHHDYTSIIDEQAYLRLQALVDDARTKGAQVVSLFPDSKPDRTQRKFPLTLVFNVSNEMQLMQREIFGPILPVKTYRNAQEVTDYINQHDRPLALYPFTYDKKLQNYYIDNVMSGGVALNTALLHVAQHDLPFGGVGASGMGHYHGREGFITFSKLRPIFRQGWLSAIKHTMLPPYTGFPTKMLRVLMRLR